jgi:hypothetical protein
MNERDSEQMVRDSIIKFAVELIIQKTLSREEKKKET